MIIISLVISIGNADRPRMYSNGIFLEPAGSLYIYDGTDKMQIHVERPFPINEFTNRTQFARCYCFSQTKPYNTTKCQNKASTMFTQHYRNALNNQLRIMTNSINTNSTRTKRGIIDYLPLLISGGNLVWNIEQETEITDIRHIAINNADNLSKITEALQDTNSKLMVAHTQYEENFKTLAEDICRNSERSWNDSMKTKAELAVKSYFQEVETEALELMEGEIPRTIEYLNLFNGICRKSCKHINIDKCHEYCEDILRKLPADMEPVFQGISISEHASYVKFEIIFPRLVSAPKPQFKTMTFGTLIKNNMKTTKIVPRLERFAAELNQSMVEIETSSCMQSRKIQLCPPNSINQYTCLEDSKFCQYTTIPSEAACTYTHTITGVAIYTMGNASLHNPITFKDIEHESVRWDGIRFVYSDVEKMIIQCPDGKEIIVPARQTTQIINVTIQSQIYDIPDPQDIMTPMQLMALNLEHKALINQVQTDQRSAHEIETRNISIIVCLMICMFAAGCITMMWKNKRDNYKRKELAHHVNLLKPQI